MWLLGGWNPEDKVHFPRICNSEVWSSTDGARWKLEGHAPWEGRHTAGYAVHQDKMWVIGGDANQKHYQNDIWNTDDGVHWKLVTDHLLWGNRVLHHTVVHEGRIWVMGGQALPQLAPAPKALHHDVWNTEDGIHWIRVTDRAAWAARGMIGGSALLDGRIWLLGGGTYQTPEHPRRTIYNEVWSSADGAQWKLHVGSAPWSPRQFHNVAAFDNKLWVLAGSDSSRPPYNKNDVWYSADGVNWHELPNTPWPIRHAASIFVHDHALWVVAGNWEVLENILHADVWKLTVARPSQTPP